MITPFQPEIGKLTTFSKHVLIWIKSGNGLLEVDFKAYSNFDDKVIFLSPEQPIKFLFGEFDTAILEFSDEFVSQSPDYRVLFKHLISLGYIQFSKTNQPVFDTFLNKNQLKILDISADQWFCQNPFQAHRDEYTVIFDLKDVIDARFSEHLSTEQMVRSLNHEYFSVNRLLKSRLGLTVKNLTQRKLLLESQKDIAFSDKPIQEVAYDMGFKDPAYFNRFFKQQTKLTPSEFRNNFGFVPTDLFVQDLLNLIKENYKSNRSTAFYADKMYMSIKTLSRKVKEKLNLTVGDLIRNEIIQNAEILLPQIGIKETAFELGFKEANHFSTFFKKYSDHTPSQFLSKKYNF